MKGTWQEGKQYGSALLKREEISLLASITVYALCFQGPNSYGFLLEFCHHRLPNLLFFTVI